MSISIQLVLAVLSSATSIAAIAVSLMALREGRRSTAREAVEDSFRRWWGEELRELRLYFFQEFVPVHRLHLRGDVGLKEIEHLIPEDKGRVRRLCYYFDQVGWFCALGLLSADQVLGPMQHAMRKTWFVMEPFIMKERKLGAERGLDPAFQLGFEWLFLYSERSEGHQAVAIGKIFGRGSSKKRELIRRLRAQIDESENGFRAGLRVDTAPASTAEAPTDQR